MQATTISKNFQICIPKKIRDELHLVPGQEFIFITKGSCIELVPKRNINTVRSLLNGTNAKNTRDRNDRA